MWFPFWRNPKFLELKKKHHIFQCWDISEKNVSDNRRKIFRNYAEFTRISCRSVSITSKITLFCEWNWIIINWRHCVICFAISQIMMHSIQSNICCDFQKKTWINNDLCPVLFLCKYDHFHRSARLFDHDLRVTLTPNDLDLHIIFNVKILKISPTLPEWIVHSTLISWSPCFYSNNYTGYNEKQENIPIGCQPPAANRTCFIMNKFKHVRGRGSCIVKSRGPCLGSWGGLGRGVPLQWSPMSRLRVEHHLWWDLMSS